MRAQLVWRKGRRLWRWPGASHARSDFAVDEQLMFVDGNPVRSSAADGCETFAGVECEANAQSVAVKFDIPQSVTWSWKIHRIRNGSLVVKITAAKVRLQLLHIGTRKCTCCEVNYLQMVRVSWSVTNSHFRIHLMDTKSSADERQLPYVLSAARWIP